MFVSAENPVPPSSNTSAMEIATIILPPYLYNAKEEPEIRMRDNRRFTMRDIANLEKRIENLEYYASLSLLEKETAARDIVGDSQIDSLFNPQGSRFKNGILVDSFIGH